MVDAGRPRPGGAGSARALAHRAGTATSGCATIASAALVVDLGDARARATARAGCARCRKRPTRWPPRVEISSPTMTSSGRPGLLGHGARRQRRVDALVVGDGDDVEAGADGVRRGSSPRPRRRPRPACGCGGRCAARRSLAHSPSPRSRPRCGKNSVDHCSGARATMRSNARASASRMLRTAASRRPAPGRGLDRHRVADPAPGPMRSIAWSQSGAPVCTGERRRTEGQARRRAEELDARARGPTDDAVGHEARRSRRAAAPP